MAFTDQTEGNGMPPGLCPLKQGTRSIERIVLEEEDVHG
jgi:hypothetical protein